MITLILGAGASKSYSDSITKVKMPIAKDFFQTFNRLDISQNRWVLIGDVLNYLKTFHNMEWFEFSNYSQDIETLHTEVEQKLNGIFQANKGVFDSFENMSIYKAYIQLIFVFASVINEIQNGKVSKSHVNLARRLGKDDRVITFNWDTLMDRALNDVCSWKPDFGYSLTPKLIYKDGWCLPEKSESPYYTQLLKLHGSTNWITSHLAPESGGLKSLQETPTSDLYVYQSTIKPYSTYEGRFMSGYSDFAYGYYPPNLPLSGRKIREGHALVKSTMTLPGMPESSGPSDGLVSMPLIIPPVRHKNYSHFGSLFSSLWSSADEALQGADRIVVIGYSFPVTDMQTDLLFKKAFIKRGTMPEIIIVDPNPGIVKDRFVFEYGIHESKIRTYKEYFNSDFDCDVLFQ